MDPVGAPDAPRLCAAAFPAGLRNSMTHFHSAGLREAVMHALSPPAVARAAEVMRERAHQLIDAFQAEGPPVDLKQHFTDPYTVTTLCTVLGLPDTDWRRMLSCLDITIMTACAPFEGAALNWDKGVARMAAYLQDPHAAQAPGLLGLLARFREQADPVPDETLATLCTPFSKPEWPAPAPRCSTPSSCCCSARRRHSGCVPIPSTSGPLSTSCCATTCPSGTACRASPRRTPNSVVWPSGPVSWSWSWWKAPTMIRRPSLPPSAWI